MTPRATTDDPVRRVLDRLDAMGRVIKHINGQDMAQCPAHDDHNPSLAVREGDDGAILQCHAGCATEDVVAAMGMTLADLFVRKERGAKVVSLHPSPAPSLSWVADYVYRDAEGTPAFKVSRYAKLSEAGVPLGKSFHQFRRDRTGAGWTAGLNGAKPPLYRLPEVLAAVAAGTPVLVVEGEKDADRAASLGAVATTSPMGAGKWRDEHTAALAGANVIIVADDDPPGRAHALGVYKALSGVAKAVQVVLPARGYKDLSEQLDAGKGLYDIRPVTLGDLGGEQADTLPIEEAALRIRLTPASAFKPRRVRWGWQDRMPVGELTLIPGREGVGKSLFLAWLAAQLTLGLLPGEFAGAPRAVLYAASEDSWHYTIGPRLTAAGADLDRIYRLDVAEGCEALTLPADVNLVMDAALGVEAAAVMLDPIISLIDERLNVNQARDLRQALEPLRRAAERAGVVVAALAHFNKQADVDALSKIPGSRAWAEVARAAFGIAEDRDQDCYVGSQIKNNLGRINLPNLAYRIESAAVDTEDGPADVGRLVWTGESDVGVEEVLGRKPEKRARETSDTTGTLIEYIETCGYPVAVAQVYDQFPEIQRETVRQTLRRAADRGTLSNPLRGHYGPPGRVSDT